MSPVMLGGAGHVAVPLEHQRRQLTASLQQAQQRLEADRQDQVYDAVAVGQAWGPTELTPQRRKAVRQVHLPGKQQRL